MFTRCKILLDALLTLDLLVLLFLLLQVPGIDKYIFIDNIFNK